MHIKIKGLAVLAISGGTFFAAFLTNFEILIFRRC